MNVVCGTDNSEYYVASNKYSIFGMYFFISRLINTFETACSFKSNRQGLIKLFAKIYVISANMYQGKI